MTIQSERIDELTFLLSPTGELDAAAAPMLERKLKQVDNNVATLILDFAGVPYVSSAGLRVLLQAWKTFNAAKRKFVIRNMQEDVKQVFDMTGFIDLLVEEEKFVVLKKEEQSTITLTAIGELKGSNIPMLEYELNKIKKIYKERTFVTNVRLDIAKLSLSPVGERLLKEALEKSGWKKRRLVVLNASAKARSFLEGVEGIYYDDKQT